MLCGIRPLLNATPLLLSGGHLARIPHSGAAADVVVRMSADYSAAAASLFANVRLPASILAGALVPLGFGFGFALPAEGPALAPGARRAIIRLHRLVAVISYTCLLLAIVYSSVTINGLAESPHQPSGSAMELIRNEYTLAWIATNVTFLLGLFGLLALVTLRVLLTFERDEGRAANTRPGRSALLPSPLARPNPRRLAPDQVPRPASASAPPSSWPASSTSRSSEAASRTTYSGWWEQHLLP